MGLHQGASRRVVLVPQSTQGTPRSIQDRESQPCEEFQSQSQFQGGQVVEVESSRALLTAPANLSMPPRVMGVAEVVDLSTPRDHVLQEWQSRNSSELSLSRRAILDGRRDGVDRSQPEDGGHSDAAESDSITFDTESVFSEADEGSVLAGVGVSKPVEDVAVEMAEIQSAPAAVRDALRFLDAVDLSEVFSRRAVVMKSVPHCVRGPFRTAMRIILQEIVTGHQTSDAVRQERAWKAFMLLPRLLLHRPCRGGLVSRDQLKARFEAFTRGEWAPLLERSRQFAEEGAVMSHRRRRRNNRNDVQHKAARALTFVQLVELSAGRHALEGAELAPGTQATLAELTNNERRPAQPRSPILQDILRFQPVRVFNLDEDKFARNLRTAKKGAAGGPSGMTTEHFRPLLDSSRDTHLFFVVGEFLARGQIPDGVAQIIRRGRMTALQKPGGGSVRGIVAGDVIRRLVARTMSQQLGPVVEQATSPFQHAMSTRAGCECIAHALQALCEEDPEMTVTSIDGVGAYDSISRRAMLTALGPIGRWGYSLAFRQDVLRLSVAVLVGRMTTARFTTFHRAKEESKAMQ